MKTIEHQLTVLKLCIARIAQSAGIERDFLADEDTLNQSCCNHACPSHDRWINLCAEIRLKFDAMKKD